MKLRYISVLLVHMCALSLFAMSPEEKAEFKRQIKAASSSREMCVLVEEQLSCSRSAMELRLRIDTPMHINWDREPMTPLFAIEADADVAITDKDRTVKNAVEEAFFEEMHQFIFEGGNSEQELAKFEKYWWANNKVVDNLRGIFRMKNTISTMPQDNQLYQLVKNRVAEVSGENNIWSGKNDISQRVLWTMHKRPGIIGRYAISGLAVVAVLGGIYYYWAGKKADEQDEDQTVAQNDQINGGQNEVA